jgi:hypothetical protein
MDYPFVPFHIRIGIAKHVELQNVAGTLMINHKTKNQEFL